MDGDQTQSLTPDQAKARLREAALRVSPGRWLSQHPVGVLAAALAGGFVVGRMGGAALARALLVRRLTFALLAMLLPRRRQK